MLEYLVLCLISFSCLQSEQLVVKKKNKRYCPVYFTKVCLTTLFVIVFLRNVMFVNSIYELVIDY